MSHTTSINRGALTRVALTALIATALCFAAVLAVATRADAATFAPTFNQTLTNPVKGGTTGLTWSITKDPAASNLKKLTITESPLLAPNFPAFGTALDMCPASSMPTSTSTFSSAACPTAAQVGTITIQTSATSQPATGNAYLIDHSPLPWIGFEVSSASVNVRFALMAQTPQLDPSCDPLVSGYCERVLAFTTTTLPNGKLTSANVTLDGPDRIGLDGPLTGKLFRVSSVCPTPAPVAGQYVTKAAFTPFSGAAVTRVDTDTISGC